MRRILLIEDDNQVRNLLREVLEKAGYKVVEASDGEQGVASYRRQPADLVITDIMMPHKDGVETIRELRHDFPQIRIVAITGYRGRFNRLPAAEVLGAGRTLVKPFTPEQILEAVKELLENQV